MPVIDRTDVFEIESVVEDGVTIGSAVGGVPGAGGNHCRVVGLDTGTNTVATSLGSGRGVRRVGQHRLANVVGVPDAPHLGVVPAHLPQSSQVGNAQHEDVHVGQPPHQGIQ